MMILARFENPDNTVLYFSLQEFYNEDWNPCHRCAEAVALQIKGRSYRERKNSLRDIAIQAQRLDVGGLYWSDVAALGDWFEENGRKYGLLREFHENAIC